MERRPSYSLTNAYLRHFTRGLRQPNALNLRAIFVDLGEDTLAPVHVKHGERVPVGNQSSDISDLAVRFSRDAEPTVRT
jgi:hypothetical protein